MVAVLEVMKKNGYIKSYKVHKDSRGGYVELVLAKLNFCKAIKPRFNVKKDSYEKYIKRFLPARGLGIIIVSTNKGLLTHAEAMEKNLGGKLIAYCY